MIGRQVATTYIHSTFVFFCLCLSLFSEALIRHPAVEAGKGNTSIRLMRMHAGRASAMRLESHCSTERR